MNIANYLLLIWLTLSTGASLVLHGKWKTYKKHNFFGDMLVLIIILTLLYFGGWFK